MLLRQLGNRGLNAAIGSSQNAVLVSAGEIGAFESQNPAEHTLDVVGDLIRVFPCGACQLLGKLVQERDLVKGAGVHEEEERVHALPPRDCGAVEQRHGILHRHRDYLVGKLGEERGESEQEGLPACGTLWAHNQVALLEELADHRGVGVTSSGQGHSLDRRQELAEARD